MEARLIHAGFLPKGNINVSALLLVILLQGMLKEKDALLPEGCGINY